MEVVRADGGCTKHRASSVKSLQTFSVLNRDNSLSLTLTKCCEPLNITIKTFYHALFATSGYCIARADIVGKQQIFTDTILINILQLGGPVNEHFLIIVIESIIVAALYVLHNVSAVANQLWINVISRRHG